MTFMELQLGLALPTHAIAVNGFDLNSHVYEPKDNLGFVFLPANCTAATTNNNASCSAAARKRSFYEAFDQVRRTVPPTLPLLRWTDQPNEEDDPSDFDNNSSVSTNEISEEDGVVGWPPIKNLRKKHRRRRLQQVHQGGGAATAEINGFGCGGSQSNSMFVKVKMEGVAIARKIDLGLHDSFESLTTTAIAMFDLWHEDSTTYELTYQDKEGNWLIAQDVPWRTFIRTVQRLRLLKSGAGDC